MNDSRPQDIILNLFSRLRDEGIEIPNQAAWRVEQLIRLEYGGTMPRISIRPPDLRERIQSMLAEGCAPATVCRALGVSRRTVQRCQRNIGGRDVDV